MAARVLLELTEDRAASVGDTTAMRAENMGTVTWGSECGGDRDNKGVFAHENARTPRNQGRLGRRG